MGQEGRGRASDLTACCARAARTEGQSGQMPEKEIKKYGNELPCSHRAHGRNVLLGMGRVLARRGWAGEIRRAQ